MDSFHSPRYEEPIRSAEDEYYNQKRRSYSYIEDDYYEDDGTELYYNDPDPDL